MIGRSGPTSSNTCASRAAVSGQRSAVSGQRSAVSGQRLYRIIERPYRQWEVQLFGINPDGSNLQPVSAPHRASTLGKAMRIAEGWESELGLWPKQE